MNKTNLSFSKSEKKQVFYLSEFETPLGLMTAIGNDSHIFFLKFSDILNLEATVKNLCKFHNAILKKDSCQVLVQLQTELDQYFEGKLKEFKTPLWITGTNFQKHSWNQLLTLDYGKLSNYSQQALEIQNPSAIRAVARANASNLIAIVIPCHRIISKNGNLSGYNGGIHRKQWLISHEQKHIRS